jgi:hypothetical protein
MKTRTITILSLAIVATLVIGAFAIDAFAAPKELKLKVKWKPATYTSDTWFPDPWLAEIFLAPPKPLNQIDPLTLLLENTYSPSAATYPTEKGNDRLVVPFYGGDVLTALLTKAPHMSPGTYFIYLEITGKLYNGQAFRGSGPINMTIPEPLPPP